MDLAPAMAPPTVAPVTTSSPGLLVDSATAIAGQMQSAIDLTAPGSQVGIEVVDTTTGAEIAGVDTDQQFYTASVVKLLIALDALERADPAPLPPDAAAAQADPPIADQVREMLTTSDDGIADELWVSDGGVDIVTRMAQKIGLPGTVPPDDPGQWGETRTTPKDVAAIYRYITATAPQPERQVIMDALEHVTEISADGTDQLFGIPAALLPGVAWAVKPGWMALNSSTTLNTTGLIAGRRGEPLRYIVVVLTTQPADIGWTAGGDALTAGVTVLRTALGLER
ncbi:serine hydrolase [Nocardia sp. BMG111209]|uniref:serine hydrolase n=1 Tax=Nocardia sp. BMG111209 TaxID=1160137 RepID=UPI0003704BFF|nr:serine hydrolase [Nocardia sp. BMG111209]